MHRKCTLLLFKYIPDNDEMEDENEASSLLPGITAEDEDLYKTARERAQQVGALLGNETHC